MTGALIFGKLPAHGDFVSRGFAPADRDRLDRWLSAEMAAARTALGELFEERFDKAPPWRFAWSGEEWVGGALAASVDSAGRRFPLLVGRSVGRAGGAAPLAQACEDAIYQALAERCPVEELEARLNALETRAEEPEPAEGWWSLGGEDFEPGALPGREPTGLIAAMLGGAERAAA